MAATTKAINLKGNPKNPEPTTHIITFPGGSIELSRTSDNEYWVHMAVHKGQIIKDIDNMSLKGTVVDARVDRIYPFGSSSEEFPNLDQIQHIAIRIGVHE